MHSAAPMVSVCMLAYNHEAYLAQAIEGVLAQKTTFPVELLVADDCSPDGTAAVAADYAARYPTQVRLLPRTCNLGMMGNFTDALLQCHGRYIALCEGDDFWTDPTKLQQQVDFLETHPDYAITYHNLDTVAADGKQSLGLLNKTPQPDTTTITDLALGNYLFTLSCVFRNYLAAGPQPTGLPTWFTQVSIGDYCLHMLNARFGKIKYFPQTMGAYRLHEAGAWSLQSQIVRSTKLFDTIHYLKQEFTGAVYQLLCQQQLHNLLVIADEAARDPTYDLTAFLEKRKAEIMQLVADDYLPFMQRLFRQHQASISAEYRMGKQLLSPARWAWQQLARFRR